MNTQDPRRGATSASNADADTLCAGRHLAQRDIPDQKTADSSHGDGIHAVLSGKAEPTTLSVEQLDIVESCQEIERRIVEIVFAGEPTKKFAEERYWVKVPDGQGGFLEHSGQVDSARRAGTKALVVDYKSLTGVVAESSSNGQLRDAAVLVAGNLLVEEVVVAIIQPLVTHSPKLCVYNKAQLKQAEIELFARVKASNDPQAKRTPGELQCKFCRARNQCPERHKWASSALPIQGSILDVPVAQWTPEQCAQFLDKEAVAQKWLDDCHKAVKDRILADAQAVPGWTSEEGNTRTTITDPQAVFDRCQKQGMTLQQFMQAISCTKGKLKEQLAVATGKKGKALNIELENVLAGLIETSQNQPSIVRVK